MKITLKVVLGSNWHHVKKKKVIERIHVSSHNEKKKLKWRKGAVLKK